MYRRVKKECIDTIIGKSYVGDWFLFYLLGQNIDSVIFKVESINNNSGLLRSSSAQLGAARNFTNFEKPLSYFNERLHPIKVFLSDGEGLKIIEINICCGINRKPL